MTWVTYFEVGQTFYEIRRKNNSFLEVELIGTVAVKGNNFPFFFTSSLVLFVVLVAINSANLLVFTGSGIC
jgi:hypothetical protein